MSFNPDWRVPPGEILREIMDEQEFSAPAVAEITGLTVDKVYRLLHGKAKLTPEIAEALQRGLGGPSAQFWVNLEMQYRKPGEAIAEFPDGPEFG